MDILNLLSCAFSEWIFSGELFSNIEKHYNSPFVLLAEAGTTPVSVATLSKKSINSSKSRTMNFSGANE